MTEKKVTDEQAMTDIYDIARTALEVHAENKMMKHVSMDFNLAKRNEKEDKFVRKHMEILHSAEKLFDKDKVRKVYRETRKGFMPKETEMKRMEGKIQEMQKQTMMILRNDMNMVNLIARNKDGMLYETILKAISEGSRKGVDEIFLEKLPLFGGMFKREGDEKK